MRTTIYCLVMVLMLLLVNHTGVIQGDGGTQQQQRRVRHQRSSANRTQTDSFREYNAHEIEVIRQWKCEVPKQRLVYWSEAIDEPPTIPPDERLRLHGTVLHRCDSCLGYCPNHVVTNVPRKCEATEKEIVTKTFMSESMNPQSPGSTYHHIRFYNHTRCGCV